MAWNLYIKFLLGGIFSFLALVEILLIAYKITKKSERLLLNIILCVVFVILAAICTSSAVFLIVTNIDYEAIFREFE